MTYYRLHSTPADARTCLAEVVAGDRSSTWLDPADVLALVEQATGDHLALVTGARCHFRGMTERRTAPLLAALDSDLDR